MEPSLTLVPAIFDLSGWHILIILLVALLLFGRRLPEIMRNLGGSVREFKKGMDVDEMRTHAPPPLPPAPPPVEGTISRDATAPRIDPPPRVNGHGGHDDHPPKA